jgi:hypothetical protein
VSTNQTREVALKTMRSVSEQSPLNDAVLALAAAVIYVGDQVGAAVKTLNSIDDRLTGL